MEHEFLNTMIFKEEVDSNSKPMKFLCVDFESYFVKISNTEGDFDDLIYEVVANDLANYFGIPTPQYKIVRVLESSYSIDDIELNKKYIVTNNIGYGSKEIPFHEIMSKDTSIISNKHDFNLYENPLDFIRIGVFDFHIKNGDRFEGNFNIILDVLSSTKKKFIAIDHIAIFGSPIAKNLFEPRLNDNLVKNILNCSFGKALISYLEMDRIKEVINDYFDRIDGIEVVIRKSFETIPECWRYNEDLPDRILRYLINEERNVYLREELNRLLKIS